MLLQGGKAAEAFDEDKNAWRCDSTLLYVFIAR
jgi:hypothetical protein